MTDAAKFAGKKILMVVPRYLPYAGGVEMHTFELASRMAAQGIDITVLSSDLSRSLPRTETRDGVRLLRVDAYPANMDLYYAPGIRNLIRDGSWDIIHSQSIHTLVPPLTMYSAKRKKIPYIITPHTSVHASWLRNVIRPLQWTILQPLIKHARQIITVSRAEDTYFRNRFRSLESRITYIPNGGNLPAVGSEVPLAGSPLIVSVGRLDPLKGHQRVISGFYALLQRCPDARLRIVGEGEFEAELRRQVSRLQLERRVEIRGVAPDKRYEMAELLASASVVTLLSSGENNPVAVLEALSLHRPVLVAYTRGLRRFVDEGMVRSVALDSSPEEIAEAILQQLEAPLVPAAIEIPTWEACTEHVIDIYLRVLARTV